MARTKTRIFAAGLLPTATVREQGKTQIFHGLPVPVQLSERKLPQHSPTVFIADEEPPTSRRTRLVPIEQLLEEAKPFLPRPSTPSKPATGGWQPRLRWLHLEGLSTGRKVRLVVGLISLAVAGYASLSDVSASTTRPPRIAAAAPSAPTLAAPLAQVAAVPPAAAVEPVAAAPEKPAPQVAAASSARPTSPLEPRRRKRDRTAIPARSKGPSDRRACDLLAAGDLTRAAKTYELLSQRTPADPVYAEAARILRIRLEQSAP